jgi:hypothetical protein
MPTKGFASHPENINRRGRPKKGETLTDLLTKELARKSVKTDLGNGQFKILRAKEAVVRKLVSLALNEDNFPAIKYIFDRMEGAPVQDVSLSAYSLPDETKKKMMDIFKEAMEEPPAPEVVREKAEWKGPDNDDMV